MVIDHGWDDGLLQFREDIRIPEKARDMDEEVFREQFQLLRVAMQQIEIAVGAVWRDVEERDPPLDPALECPGLVMREILRRLRAHELDDLRQPDVDGRLHRGNGRRRRGGMGLRQDRSKGDEGLRDLRHRQDTIDHAGLDRGAGHPIIGSLGWLLRDNKPALFADGEEAGAAIRAGTGENDAAGLAAIRGGEGCEQKVEGTTCAMADRRLRQVERPMLDREIGAGRNDIEILGLDAHARCRFQNAQRGVAGQERCHHARMAGVEMLDKDQGVTGAGGHGVHELRRGVEASG
jgi:hypothetical protein